MAVEAGPARGPDAHGGAVPAGPPRRRPQPGRWALDAAVLGLFIVLVLAPTAALVRVVVVGGLAPLERALLDPSAQHALGLTFAIAALATASNTVFGVAFALVLERQRFRGRHLADGLVELPVAVSPVIAGLMLVILYGPDGWFGHGLEALGCRVIYAVPGMVLATQFVTLPLVARSVGPVLREFGTEQIEAARTLGAGRWQTFRRVTLPSIRWGLAQGATLTAARSIGEFGAVLVVSGNLVGRTQTATLYVHDGIESLEPGPAHVVSLLLAGVSCTLLFGVEHARTRRAARKRPHASSST